MADYTFTTSTTDARPTIVSQASYTNGVYDLDGDITIDNNLTVDIDRINLVIQGLNRSGWRGAGATTGNNLGRLRLTDSTLIVHNESNRSICDGGEFDRCKIVFTGKRNQGGFNGAINARVNSLFRNCNLVNMTTTDGTSGASGVEGDLGNPQNLTLEIRTWTELSATTLYRCGLGFYTSGRVSGLRFTGNGQTASVAASPDGTSSIDMEFYDNIIDASCHEDSSIISVWSTNSGSRVFKILNFIDERSTRTGYDWFRRNFLSFIKRSIGDRIEFYVRYHIALNLDNPTEDRKMVLWGASATPLIDVISSTNEFPEQILQIARIDNIVSATTALAIRPSYNYIDAGSYDYFSESGASDVADEINNAPNVYHFLVDCYGFVPTTENNFHISYVNGEGSKGTETERKVYRIEVDSNISERDSAVVSGYMELETASKLYDYDGYHCYINPTKGLVGNRRLSRSDTTINAGAYNITIDSTASQVFQISGDTITIKATTFAGSLITTGAVILSNGATVTGSILDSTGDSEATINAPTGYNNISVHATQSDADDNLNVLFGGARIRYQSGTHGGSTLWLRLSDGAGKEIVVSQEFPVDAGIYNFVPLPGESDQIRALQETVDEVKIIVESARDYALAADSQTQTQGSLHQTIDEVKAIAEEGRDHALASNVQTQN